MSKAQRDKVTSCIRRNAVSFVPMTVTGCQEAQGEEGGEETHLGAGRAHYIFPFLLAILVLLSSLVRILAEGAHDFAPSCLFPLYRNSGS